MITPGKKLCYSKCLSRRKWKPNLEWMERVSLVCRSPNCSPIHPTPFSALLHCLVSIYWLNATVGSLVPWLPLGLGQWRIIEGDEWRGGLKRVRTGGYLFFRFPACGVTQGCFRAPVPWSKLLRALLLSLSSLLLVPRTTPCPSPFGPGSGNYNPPTSYRVLHYPCGFLTLCPL